MTFGTRILQWLRSIDVWVRFVAYKNAFWVRLHAVGGPLQSQVIGLVKAGQITQALIVYFAGIFYIAFGDAVFHPQTLLPSGQEAVDEVEAFKANPQGYLQAKLHEFGTSAETQAYAEFIGTIITEPVVSLLEKYAGDANPDPHAMARSFHGIASGLPWASGVIDSILKTVLGNRAPEVGKHVMSLYWGLGLGFLGWQTLAPLLSNGLQPNLERYYNRLYRSNRFTPSQMSDLFALGTISAAQMQEGLRDLGWRDQDISTWIALSYRTLSEGNVWKLYHDGHISQAEAQKRLRASGYSPQDIPLLFLANPKEDDTDATRYTVSTAKAALKARQISTDEFRQILTSLKYAPREIELQIQLITAQKEEEERELSTAQVRGLYNARIIGKDEARHNLTQLRYTTEVANQLIKLWDQEAVPKAARINKSTIEDGYETGVLSRGKAKDLLQQEAGYSSENAELILKIVEAQIAARAQPTAGQGNLLSLSQISQFVTAGLVTRSEVEGRAEFDRFSPEDKTRLIDLMFLEPATKQVTLNQSQLLDAYVFGLLSRIELATRLENFGLPAEDIEILIGTVEAANPTVFGEFQEAFLAQPSVGSLQLALQRELINEKEFTQRLAAQGYSPDAITVYLFNAQYQAPVEPKQLTKADILSLYQRQLLSRNQAKSRLQRLGYTIEDADLLVEAKELPIEETQVGAAYLAGFINQAGAASALTDLGYSPSEIENFFLIAQEFFEL